MNSVLRHKILQIAADHIVHFRRTTDQSSRELLTFDDFCDLFVVKSSLDLINALRCLALRNSDEGFKVVEHKFLAIFVCFKDNIETLQIFWEIDRQVQCQSEIQRQPSNPCRLRHLSENFKQYFVDQVEERQDSGSTTECNKMPFLQLESPSEGPVDSYFLAHWKIVQILTETSNLILFDDEWQLIDCLWHFVQNWITNRIVKIVADAIDVLSVVG